MENGKIFEQKYKGLNKEQKLTVDTIEGPVMVIAGPGTGKTEVLTLRIANILNKTDIGAGGILCLTFTRSGVNAMQKRLESYIGVTANKVKISTFHSFAIEIIEKYYGVIGFHKMPKLIDDTESIFLFDEILNENVWEYINPRGRSEQYFNDLKSLIGTMKREGKSPEDFLLMIVEEIENIQNNGDNISSRGESKGKLKKEFVTKIESLERTKEAVKFYEIYEERKKDEGFMDYDDVLEFIVDIVKESDEARAQIAEDYQYILVDEHQDSSGVQNEFLRAVWEDAETQNIFVVGDDRQLIYGFSGASMKYFEEFSNSFKKTKLITLVENYRSTDKILRLADEVQTSALATDKLRSNTKDNFEINLNEYAYPRDEVIGAGLYFKKQIENGTNPNQCALLVPKNYLVKNAIETLTNMGLKVSSGKDISLFSDKKSLEFLGILKIITNPSDEVNLARSLFWEISAIGRTEASIFLKKLKGSNFTLLDLIANGADETLFANENKIKQWGRNLKEFIEKNQNENLVKVVSLIGNEFFINKKQSHEELVRAVEITRSFIHLATRFSEKNINGGINEFLEYIERLMKYGNHISLDVFGESEGIKVMTLHKSKGLEFESVWIAHMNERTLMSEKRRAFTLPAKFDEILEKRSEENAKRELYVAITRAKKFCNISYALNDYNGGDMALAKILQDIPHTHFIKKDKIQTEKEIIENGYEVYTSVQNKIESNSVEDLLTFVKSSYESTTVSVSLLNNFYECPWKWYFRNFLKLPEVKSDNLALGTVVHAGIEFILKSEKVPSEIVLKKEIEKSLIQEGVKDKKTIIKMTNEAIKILSNWVSGDYKLLEKIRESERSVSVSDNDFKNLKIYGKVDLTERTKEGAIIITDFKTGSVKTVRDIEKEDEEGRLSNLMRQLTMYSYLVRQSEKKDVYSCKLHFLEAKESDKNKIYSTHITDGQIEMLRGDIAEYKEFLVSGEWINRPCYAKIYGVNKECEYCKLAKEIYGKNM